jgi:hypothetical protein
MDRFRKISGTGFQIGKGGLGAYFGTSVASPDAFFLVLGANAIQLGMVQRGGILGYWLANYLERRSGLDTRLQGSKGIILADLADLPVDIIGDPDWPVHQEEGPVLVVPREAIDAIWYSFWKWGIYLRSGEVKIKLEPPWFGRKRLFGWLQAVGWEIDGVPTSKRQ